MHKTHLMWALVISIRLQWSCNFTDMYCNWSFYLVFCMFACVCALFLHFVLFICLPLSKQLLCLHLTGKWTHFGFFWLMTFVIGLEIFLACHIMIYKKTNSSSTPIPSSCTSILNVKLLLCPQIKSRKSKIPFTPEEVVRCGSVSFLSLKYLIKPSNKS